MPDKFIKSTIIADFRGGKNIIEESDEIEATEARQVINANLDRNRGVQPRKGIKIDGAFSTTSNPVNSAHTFTTKNGDERTVRSTGTILEYKNTYITTPAWLTLETGYTTSKIFGLVDGDTKGYFCNGVETIRQWSLAIGVFDKDNSATAIIALNAQGDLDSAAKLGFTATGTAVIAGNLYTYTGRSGLTLTGVNTTPLGETDGAGVAEVPVSTGFTTAPLGNILLIRDSRLLMAGVADNENALYGSKIGNVLDFSFSTPALADDGFVVKFWGKPITALGNMVSYVAVMKKDGSKRLSFTKLQSSTDTILTVPKLDNGFDGEGLGAVNMKGTIQLNYDFLFTSKEVGLRKMSRALGDDIDKPESLTEKIETDFEDYDLSDVATDVFKEQIHIALKSSSNPSGNEVVVLKDTRTGFIGTYLGINASCWFHRDNKLFCGDSFTKNCWQLYSDDYSDFDGTNYYDYLFRWRSKFFHYGLPEHLKELGFVWLEGYILPNTTAKFKMNFKTENGIETIIKEIKGTDPYVFISPSSAFGRRKFGEIALAAGEDFDLPSGARFFQVMITPETLELTDTKWLQVQFELEHSKAGDYAKLTKLRPFINVLPIEETKTNKILANIT